VRSRRVGWPRFAWDTPVPACRLRASRRGRPPGRWSPPPGTPPPRRLLLLRGAIGAERGRCPACRLPPAWADCPSSWRWAAAMPAGVGPFRTTRGISCEARDTSVCHRLSACRWARRATEVRAASEGAAGRDPRRCGGVLDVCTSGAVRRRRCRSQRPSEAQSAGPALAAVVVARGPRVTAKSGDPPFDGGRLAPGRPLLPQPLAMLHARFSVPGHRLALVARSEMRRHRSPRRHRRQALGLRRRPNRPQPEAVGQRRGQPVRAHLCRPPRGHRIERARTGGAACTPPSAPGLPRNAPSSSAYTPRRSGWGSCDRAVAAPRTA